MWQTPSVTQQVPGQPASGQPVFGQQPGQPYGYAQVPGTAAGGPPYGQHPGVAVPGGTPASSNRTGLILITIGVVVLLLLALTGLWYSMGRDSGYEVGACVKKGPDNSVLDTGCEDKDAFKIVKKASKQEDCQEPDATVTLQWRGRTEILCLKKVR